MALVFLQMLLNTFQAFAGALFFGWFALPLIWPVLIADERFAFCLVVVLLTVAAITKTIRDILLTLEPGGRRDRD